MGATLPERQKWLENALQGLAFWIGHRHSLFNGYPLVEGALVAEACNLIQAIPGRCGRDGNGDVRRRRCHQASRRVELADHGC